MKIRNGFVSNSSSSSFIICFPKDFSVEKYIDKKEDFIENFNCEHDIDITKSEFIRRFNKFVGDGGAWEDDCGEYPVACEFVDDFEIVSTDSSSGQGVIDIIKGDELLEKLKKLGYE